MIQQQIENEKVAAGAIINAMTKQQTTINRIRLRPAGSRITLSLLHYQMTVSFGFAYFAPLDSVVPIRSGDMNGQRYHWNEDVSMLC